MTGKEKVIITIAEDGSIEIETTGFKDAGCLKIFDEFAKHFPGRLINERRKPEARIQVPNKTIQVGNK